MPVSVVEQDGRIAVSSPYHPNFPARARSLGGIWDARRRVWVFDAGDHDRVRSLCRQVYGTDGPENGKGVIKRSLTQVVASRGAASPGHSRALLG